MQTVSAITVRYRRAVAKIGLHYALAAMPQLSGLEREFDAVKRFISEGAGDPREFVELSDRQVLWQIQQGMVPTSWCHLLGASVDRGVMRARLQFFLGPLGAPPVWTVTLGADPFRILASRRPGVLAIYFATKQERKARRHDGFLHELQGGENTLWMPTSMSGTVSPRTGRVRGGNASRTCTHGVAFSKASSAH